MAFTLCAGHARYGCTSALARTVKPAQVKFPSFTGQIKERNGISRRCMAFTLCAGHARYGCTSALARTVKPAQNVFPSFTDSPSTERALPHVRRVYSPLEMTERGIPAIVQYDFRFFD